MTEVKYILKKLEEFQALPTDDISAVKREQNKTLQASMLLSKLQNGSSVCFHQCVKLLKEVRPDLLQNVNFYIEKQTEDSEEKHTAAKRQGPDEIQGTQRVGEKDSSVDKKTQRRLARGDEALSLKPTESKTENILKTEFDMKEKKLFIKVDPVTLGSVFDIDSMVEVHLQGIPNFGVIRWIGFYGDGDKPIAGIELEEERPAGSDGTYMNVKLFHCPSNKAIFTFLENCWPDRRFDHQTTRTTYMQETAPSISHIYQPWSLDKVKDVCRKRRGIQGHKKSSFLDSALFCMFAFAKDFDSIFKERDNAGKGLLKVLQESIVNRLRGLCIVPAGNVYAFRTKLRREISDRDPVPFLRLLLGKVAQANPYIILRSNRAVFKEDFIYRIQSEWNEKLIMPTTQQLLNLSFQCNTHGKGTCGQEKFVEIPRCLILRLPIEDKKIRRIYPSLELDITDLVLNAPKDCTLCGKKVAAAECHECYRHLGEHKDMCTIPFCEDCFELFHRSPERKAHKISLLPKTCTKDAKTPVRRVKMELFAVICKDNEQYVSFAMCGTGSKTAWVFFDSMAYEQGHSYVSEVAECPRVSRILSREGRIEANSMENKDLPEPLRLIVAQPYLCFYRHK